MISLSSMFLFLVCFFFLIQKNAIIDHFNVGKIICRRFSQWDVSPPVPASALSALVCCRHFAAFKSLISKHFQLYLQLLLSCFSNFLFWTILNSSSTILCKLYIHLFFNGFVFKQLFFYICVNHLVLKNTCFHPKHNQFKWKYQTILIEEGQAQF